MRTWVRAGFALLLLGCGLTAEAHIGSPNVFLEDKAGEYPVRVVIRPPNVVPGLAEITVRVPEPVERVAVLPVFWKAGRAGSPPPDEARRVRGETNLYAAELWLMKPGAYSVDVTVEGPRGRGTLVVPVNSMATNTRPMSRGYGLMLSALGGLLFLGGLRIAGAVFGESRVEPGALPTRKDRWRGRAAMALTAIALSLLLFGGKKWWDHEDRQYRNNALYQLLPVTAEVRTEREQPVLTLTVNPTERRGRWTPLIPDHGKLMHCFLVRDGEPAFAHLHPARRSEVEFAVPLPPLPAGRYHVYADVTHEDGFSETLTATAELPPPSLASRRLWLGNSAEPVCSAAVAQRLATNLFFPPDPDDSWHLDNGAAVSGARENDSADRPTRPETEVGGGYRMVWENPESRLQNLEGSLRFKLLTPDNQPAPLEPYMGMLGHAVVRRQDGAVFAHVHPVGTFSMAAQNYFVSGKPPQDSPAPAGGVSEGSPPATELHSHTNRAGAAGDLSFPYAFPEPGAYRLWVQMKSNGRILTGRFDATVTARR